MSTIVQQTPDFAPGSKLVFRFWKGSSWKNTALTVQKRMTSGGQADVYVVTDDAGHPWCMKYLYGNYATDKRKFYNKIQLMAKFPSPSPQLAWPIAFSPITSSTGAFYYLMPLYEGYSEVSRIISWLKRYNGKGGVNPNSPAFHPVKVSGDPNNPAGMSLVQRAEVAAGISDAVGSIHGDHEASYVYGDISGKNFLYKVLPDGHVDVKTIDMDNLLPTGSNASHPIGFNLGLIGTGQYPAPEIILGNSVPTLHSDLHALAVLAFRIFLGAHPLDGALTHSMELTPENICRFYGEEPEFIITSHRNCASAAVQQGWNYLPQATQLYFKFMFSPEILNSGVVKPGVKEPRLTAGTLRQCLHKDFGV